jgi:sugar/nucleoside kinase (ribokinase family)
LSWDVVGVGENSVDFVHLLPAWPQPGGPSAKMQIRERVVLFGGQMATAMCACASFGLRATYVGVVGRDEAGRGVRDELARRGVDVGAVVERDVPNRYAVILVEEPTGERVILWNRDERLNLREDELPLEAIARARIVHVDGTDEAAAIRAAAAGRGGGALVTTDIDQVTPRTMELIGLATHAILADDVPCRLTGVDGLETALRELRKACDATLVVTRGKRGAVALDGDRMHREPAFDVTAVDTTGAGDVFRGGFIYALAHGRPIDEALRTANAAAAASCTRLGAINGVPSLEEIQCLLRRTCR